MVDMQTITTRLCDITYESIICYDVINDNISQLIILRMIGVDGFARGTKNFMEWSFINDCTS